MAIALEVVEKTDEHGRYVEFRLSNNKEYLIKMDLFDFDRIKYNTCYYVHRHVKGGKYLPYVRRAIYEGNKTFTSQIHREILLKDSHDKNLFIVFKDNDSLNIRRHNMEVKDERKICRRHRFTQTYVNSEKYGVRNISITKLTKKNQFQAYHKGHYIGNSINMDTLETKIHEYILKNNLKETNGI
jgi:hypothetical protein